MVQLAHPIVRGTSSLANANAKAANARLKSGSAHAARSSVVNVAMPQERVKWQVKLQGRAVAKENVVEVVLS